MVEARPGAVCVEVVHEGRKHETGPREVLFNDQPEEVPHRSPLVRVSEVKARQAGTTSDYCVQFSVGRHPSEPCTFDEEFSPGFGETVPFLILAAI